MVNLKLKSLEALVVGVPEAVAVATIFKTYDYIRPILTDNMTARNASVFAGVALGTLTFIGLLYVANCIDRRYNLHNGVSN